MNEDSKSTVTVDDIDYEVGQDNVQIFGLDIHNPVFAVSGGVIVAFVVLSLLFPAVTEEFFGWLRPWLTDNFDWFLMIAGNLFVLFSLALIVTPLGPTTAIWAGSPCCLQPAWASA